MEFYCGRVVSAPDTDYICIAHPSHAGDCDLVDAMGFDGIDSDRNPLYRKGFRHAR